MPRLPFLTIATGALALTGMWSAAADFGGHFEPGKLVGSCTPCHVGHGAPRTPMLRSSADDMCLSCHESGAAEPGRRELLGMGTAASPADIRSEITRPVVHRGARCVDCHSVHGIARLPGGGFDDFNVGRIKPSTKRGFSTEAELCLSCHGTRAASPTDPHDLGLLFDPRNPSYHPVLALSSGDVPSLLPPLSSDSMINCSDCHASDDPGAPKGPHGSRVPGLLGADYARQDGQPESPSTYRLCYRCHDRDVVLDSDPFPLHRLHVVEDRAPCGLCHDPHGATAARALIRFNEVTSITGVNASGSGRLGYESDSAGSGACYLSCHGVDHDPLGYGPLFTADGRPRMADPSDLLGRPGVELVRPRTGPDRD